MSGIHRMKVNFYTTDGSEVEDRTHVCEEDSLEGLKNLVEEIQELPNVSDDILSVEFDLHIKSRQDIVEAITLLNSSMPLFDD
jgi:hypothetical protein